MVSNISFFSHVASGDPSDSLLNSCPSREVPPQRPTTLPSSPRRPPSTALPTQKPNPASPRSPQQETTGGAARKSSSSSLTPSVPRSYMSPTASSMAKMSRSISMGDGLNIPEAAEDPALTSLLPGVNSSQVKDTQPPLVAVVHSTAALATPPHAAVVPVVISSSSSSNRLAPPSRSLQARVPSSSSRPLPDKPSLDSFTPSSKSTASSSMTSTSTQTSFPDNQSSLSPSNNFDTTSPLLPVPAASPLPMAAVAQNGLVSVTNGKLSPPRFPIGVVGGTVTGPGYGFEASEEDIDVDDKVEDLMR